MMIDRRQFAMLGVLAAASSGLGTGRVVPQSAMLLDTMRVCNTDCYAKADRLFDCEVGTRIDVRFDYDPDFVEDASTGFWLAGVKVGDAPRMQRQWLGRMIHAGRRLRGEISGFRPASEYGKKSCQVAVSLDRQAVQPHMTCAVFDDFMQAEVRTVEAERFVRLVGETTGRPPMFLGGEIVDDRRGPLFPGEPLKMVVVEGRNQVHHGVGFSRLDGEFVGALRSSHDRLVHRMLTSGAVIGAVALPPFPSNDYAPVGLYLIS